MSARTARVTSTSQAVSGNAPRLMGWTVNENAGTAAAAEVNIYRGTAATAANRVVAINLSADESAGEWYGPQGVHCPDGIYVEIASGTVEVVIYHS